jgi:ribosome maturation factor RimP
LRYADAGAVRAGAAELAPASRQKRRFAHAAYRLDLGKYESCGSRLADEEVEMPGSHRSIAGPVDDASTGGATRRAPRTSSDEKAAASNKRLADLIEPAVVAVGMDLESVRVTVAGRRRLLRVVVDSDHGVSLDDAADVSREVSAVLDAANALGDVPYTLEVSSPGVDRPLTAPSHWRRAAGRLVRVKVTGEGSVEGRVVAADSGGVTMNVAGNERQFGYGALGAGAIQVEFGRVPDSDLEDFSDSELDDAVLDNDTDLGAGSDGH